MSDKTAMKKAKTQKVVHSKTAKRKGKTKMVGAFQDDEEKRSSINVGDTFKFSRSQTTVKVSKVSGDGTFVIDETAAASGIPVPRHWEGVRADQLESQSS